MAAAEMALATAARGLRPAELATAVVLTITAHLALGGARDHGGPRARDRSDDGTRNRGSAFPSGAGIPSMHAMKRIESLRGDFVRFPSS